MNAGIVSKASLRKQKPAHMGSSSPSGVHLCADRCSSEWHTSACMLWIRRTSNLGALDLQRRLLCRRFADSVKVLADRPTDAASAAATCAPTEPLSGPLTLHEQHMLSVLCALTHRASLVDPSRHQALLRVLWQLSLWTLHEQVAASWAQLLMHLVSAQPALMQPCVRYLVDSFAPPRSVAAAAAGGEDALTAPLAALYAPDARTVTVHALILRTLEQLVLARPLLANAVRDVAGARMPHKLAPLPLLCAYLRGMLALARSPAVGPAMADALLLKAIEKAVELDCEIRWQEIAHHLSGAAVAEEAAAPADNGDASDDDVFAQMAAEARGSQGGAACGEGEGSMEASVEALRLSQRPAHDPRCQLGASCVLC